MFFLSPPPPPPPCILIRPFQIFYNDFCKRCIFGAFPTELCRAIVWTVGSHQNSITFKNGALNQTVVSSQLSTKLLASRPSGNWDPLHKFHTQELDSPVPPLTGRPWGIDKLAVPIKGISGCIHTWFLRLPAAICRRFQASLCPPHM
jgi:hypothetical protein